MAGWRRCDGDDGDGSRMKQRLCVCHPARGVQRWKGVDAREGDGEGRKVCRRTERTPDSWLVNRD